MTATNSIRADTIIFLHIHKTAGTTLHRIIERQYRPEQIWTLDEEHGFDDLVSLTEAQRAQVRMLRGHMIFSLHELMPGITTYFTLLREPVERVISFYYFIRRNPHHYHYDPITSEDLSLKEFLELRQNNMMDNGQTRMLAGAKQYEHPVGECTRELLEAAKQNLRERFSVVGLMERFDETLLLLRQAYGWRNVFYVQQNVTSGRPLREDLPRDALDVVAEYNQLDIELYEYSAALFEEQVQQQGPRFARQVQVFRLANRYLARPVLLGWGNLIQRAGANARRRLQH